MREISRATVSSRSPRQSVSSSCLRTAGVGSTGKSAAAFIAGVSKVSGSVASVDRNASPQVAYASQSRASGTVASEFVASASVASVVHASVELGVSRSCPPVSSSVVAFARQHGVRSASVSGCLSSPASIARRLRSSVSGASQSSSVASRGVAFPSVAFLSVASRSVQRSPRSELRRAFQRLAEATRDGLSKRLSRRFGSVEKAAWRERLPVSCSVASVPSELRRASPARAWRFH